MRLLAPKPPACPAAACAAFSLIEALISLTLVFAIATIYFGFSAPDRRRNSQKVCQANLQKIFLALEIYAQDHTGKFPVTTGAKTSEEPLDLLIPRYSADTTIFHCPAAKGSPPPAGEALRSSKISYAYFMGRHSGGETNVLMSDAQVSTQAKSAGAEIFSTTGRAPGNNHAKAGGNLLFSDGHVEWSLPQLSFSLPLPPDVVLLNPKP